MQAAAQSAENNSSSLDALKKEQEQKVASLKSAHDAAVSQLSAAKETQEKSEAKILRFIAQRHGDQAAADIRRVLAGEDVAPPSVTPPEAKAISPAPTKLIDLNQSTPPLTNMQQGTPGSWEDLETSPSPMFTIDDKNNP